MNIWSKKIRNLIFVIIMPKNIKLAHFFFFMLIVTGLLNFLLPILNFYCLLDLLFSVHKLYFFFFTKLIGIFLLRPYESLWNLRFILEPQWFIFKLNSKDLWVRILWFIIFYRSNDLTQQNWQKELCFGQNKNMNEV